MHRSGRNIRTVEDVLQLLDTLFAPEADRWTAEAASWWDGFYADRAKPVPFFVAKPDENLVSYLDRGLIPGAGRSRAGSGGRVLDLGCGPGRNALHLAARGFRVDAVDLSPTAIAWAEERATEAEAGAGVGAEADVRFLCGDAFALADGALDGPYDLVYDSGCFHHLPPHRRISYLALLDRVLAPGGLFALTCFAAAEEPGPDGPGSAGPGSSGMGPAGMGSELSDADFYRDSRLHGGIAYTPESLRWIFSDLTEVELRRMYDEPAESACFGEEFLWTALFRR